LFRLQNWKYFLKFAVLLGGGYVKFLKAYEVGIIRLKEGRHEFSFPVNNGFFDCFEGNGILSKGKLLATVVLQKDAKLIEAEIRIAGTVELTCDRSLEIFDYPLTSTQKVLYKYGPEEMEINEDIYMITRDTPVVNFAQLIYEFILLAVPAKKIHPDYLGEMDEDDYQDEGKLVYVSDGESLDDDENTPDNTDSDPRWEILKKLKKTD